MDVALVILSKIPTVEQAPSEILEAPGSLTRISSRQPFLPAPQFLDGWMSAKRANIQVADNLLIRLSLCDQLMKAASLIGQLAIDQVAIEQVQLGRQATARR